MPAAGSLGLACRSDHHQPIRAGFRQPDLSRAAKDLAHVGVGLGRRVAGEALGGGIEREDRIGPPIGDPDDIALIHVDGIGLGSVARQLPFAPGIRLRIVEPPSLTPGSSIVVSVQNTDVDIGLRHGPKGSALPMFPQSVSRGARFSGLLWFATVTACQVAGPPVRI